LSEFTVKPTQFRKVQGNVQFESAAGKSEAVEAIIKVKEPDYVPDTLRVRSRIDAYIVTGEISTEDLSKLENDPKVESVSVSRRLRVIE
jgi:hypothetical protein